MGEGSIEFGSSKIFTFVNISAATDKDWRNDDGIQGTGWFLTGLNFRRIGGRRFGAKRKPVSVTLNAQDVFVYRACQEFCKSEAS